MSWNTIPGVACIIAFFFPVFIIIYNRFYTHRSLAALLFYYINTAIVTMMYQGIIRVPASVRLNYGILNNYLDVPLMLTSLLFFCPGKQKQRIIYFLILGYIIFELIVTAIVGFNRQAIVYIMGPGMILILGYAFYLFVRQVKFTIIHGKNMGRTLMLASILFAYSCYTLIYYFYYILKTPYKADTLLLYFISSFIGSVLMAVGLHLMRNRIKEFHSVKITRKELATFFNH